MKKHYLLLFIVFSFLQAAYSQGLYIDSTRFITGSKCCTEIRYAIPTADKGILFVGDDGANPEGIIPFFPLDTINANVLIGKIDSNQQISWIKVYGGSDDDVAFSACQTPDGGYAILASTTSSNGNVTGFKGGVDIWLLRVDALGNLVWGKTYGSSQSDGAMSVTNTPDHGFIILGATNGSDEDVPFHNGSFFSMDWLVIKTDSVGNIQWNKDIGGTGEEVQSGSILAVDNSYYLVSSSNSNDNDCIDTIWHSGENTGTDYYILKLNNAGTVLWSHSYGGSNGDAVHNAIFDTRDSTLVITGNTSSHDYMVTGYHGGETDMWVIKVNKAGMLLWQKTLGGPNRDGGTGICTAHNGGYAAYGTTFPGPIGISDCLLFMLDDGGNEKDSKIFGGDKNEQPNSIIPYQNGYIAAGFSVSGLFTEGPTNCTYINGGGFVSYIDTGKLAINKTDRLKHLMAVYPNPSQDKVRITIAGNETSTLSIINSMGQVVYAATLKPQTTEWDINISRWAYGMYCIVWKSENGKVLTDKFIKN